MLDGLYGWDIEQEKEDRFFGEKEWAAWVIWRLKRSEGGGFLFRKPVDRFSVLIWDLWVWWV